MLTAMVLAALLAAAPVPDAAAVAAGGAPRVYYEVRTPAGKPRGVVLAFHPGGWCGVSDADDRECGAAENRVRDDQPDGAYEDPMGGRTFTEIQRDAVAGGYITVGASYATDEAGLADVVALHDQAAQRWPDLPIFAWGSSAGGHWALVLGALRPLAGVVAEGAPADFTAWARGEQGAYYLDEVLPAVFGARTEAAPNLADYDPGRLYPPARTPVFLISGEGDTDPLVGEAVARAFAARAGDVGVRTLSAGGHWWVHARVDASDLRRARTAALAFLDARGS